jgi:hypothetical protein
MQRLTVAQARHLIAKVVQGGECPSSPAVLARINEAQQRLLPKGLWVNTVMRYAFCTYGNCISLPRELSTILAIGIGDKPERVNSPWYEFLDNGPGIANGCASCASGGQLPQGVFLAGSAPTFRDVCGVKKLRVYTDLTEDTGLKLFYSGYDANGYKIRTLHNGSWVYGEYINLFGPMPVTATQDVVSVDRVILPSGLKGYVRLYEYDQNTGTEQALAFYAPDETSPIYPRYRIPSSASTCATCGNGKQQVVTVLAKRRYIPAVNETDDLLITNIAALKNMVMAIEKEEAGNIRDAEALEARALRYLQEELNEHIGGQQGAFNIQMTNWADIATNSR